MSVVVGVVITLDILIILLNILMAIHLKKVWFLSYQPSVVVSIVKYSQYLTGVAQQSTQFFILS